ncbi:NERD domain-containing protein (plasmid) [Streptomyces sp. NA02950]|uniref:nuclease-related domain-containing protein n=1 Tax=Streptomyces sp. NA02950 TaxID=2742137 RepID=UPI001592AA82|nr:nuclease-related domain-containing protein [Streptomyces sp. NA02950]QKV98157.1 NERD domain-containing protein [Streptomyces sp. NA02950]
MSAGNSAQARADATLQAAQPTGLWARTRAYFGFGAEPSAEAVEEAANWEAGAEGERRTAELVRALAPEGWFGLFDRHIPGLDVANVDIALISPSGKVIPVDAKLWHRHAVVHAVKDQLAHGDKKYPRVISSVLFETSQIDQSLHNALARRGTDRTVEVTPLIAMHNAPVSGDGFTVKGVQVVPADRLLSVLREMAGPPDPEWAAYVAGVLEQLLPRYVEGGRR